MENKIMTGINERADYTKTAEQCW